jgi:hypothetical protein
MSVDIKMSLSHNFSGSHAMFKNIVIIKAMLTDFYILIGDTTKFENSIFDQ